MTRGKTKRARAVMVLGTASNVGKSLIVAGLCRHLARAGVRVAPFKAQNMSLNSAATPEGLEIGRAQAMQAEAAGVAPSADMNPVLLKPTSEVGSQVIVHGRIWGSFDARDFSGTAKRALMPYVMESFGRLAAAYDVIVIEGAGSPAEINLRDGDIVNMAMAHAADAECILVGDIDRGGVFASIYGTLALLDDEDRRRITGFAINKFRGDVSLLQPGIETLQTRVGTRCLGVIPHLRDIGLDEEDSVVLEDRAAQRAWNAGREDDRLRIAVVALPRLANFTDFDALAEEPSVDLRYSAIDSDLARADVVILPGTKDTIADLRWLRERGLDRVVLQAAQRTIIVGICGGMQMLGRAIHDPHGVESGGSIDGLDLLALETVLTPEKTTVPVRGEVVAPVLCGAVPTVSRFDGYEIHVGETRYGDGVLPFAKLVRGDGAEAYRDGAVAHDGKIVATYVHGLFDDDAFRHAFLAAARDRAQLAPAKEWNDRRAKRESRFDRLADVLAASLDLTALFPELPVGV